MQIVILGAGYAGLRAAIDLDRLLRERKRTDAVILVDQFPYHQLVQVLHHTVASSAPVQEAIYDLATLLQKSEVRFVQGRAARLLPHECRVELEDGQSLPYDRLVLTLGAETAYLVPGAQEHTLDLRTYEHAVRLHNHLIAQFTAAAQTTDQQQQRMLMTTAIVGGSYTGCQLAGELAAWVDDLCRETGAPRSQVRIALVERGHLLLRQFGLWATREAERALDRLGVSVYLDTAVESVEPQTLRVAGGRVLRAATLVWAAGMKGPDLLRESGLPVDATGHVRTDRYLRVIDYPVIFAAGDCAAIPDLVEGQVPSTASYAMRQGSHLAESLLAEIEGRPPRTYEPVRLGELVSLGPEYAVGNPLGMPIVGYPAVLMKRGIETWYRSILTGKA
ncbi:MAG: NAD(P)/FAD-dependent oxidoreductase [Chloroflexales bacterium]|nr:NAD(P)/FAD-dependent oxidoreductase [Chloroflexales bacterium]